MHYLILGFDGTDEEALARRLAVRQQHIALADKMIDKGKKIYGAGILNEKGEMCGSIIVGNFETREDLDEYLSQEPYKNSNVWKTLDVYELQPGPRYMGAQYRPRPAPVEK